MLIHRLCKSLDARRVPYALVGGHAVALHGAVRGTVDVDFVIRWSRDHLLRAEAALGDCGLVSRLPLTAEDVFRFRDEYIRNRNLLAWSFWNPEDPAEQVDLIINFDLAGHRVRRLATKQGPVRLLHIDDLIAMKRESGRPQDLADVAALEKLR
jgi:hypothetical protein